MKQPWASKGILLQSAVVALVIFVFCLNSAQADIVCNDNSTISHELQLPLCQWTDTEATPQAVVVAVHGLIMHGTAYDALGRALASQGFVVVAPDLRGYGQWYHGPNVPKKERAVSYETSYKDVVRITERLHLDYPNLPVFLIGESLGADIVIRVASTHPGMVNGLVLSSPAIKHRLVVLPRMLAEAGLLMANPRRQIDLSPYIKYASSEDPRVRNEILNDPLARKNLSVRELLKSLATMKATLGFVRRISPATPVLVIQGNADRTLKANAVVLLLSRLKSTDQTVKWFPHSGHVLLETAYLQPFALETVQGWLKQHIRQTPLYQVGLK